MSAGTNIMDGGAARIGYPMGWLIGIVEAALVMVAMAFFLIAAFLAPAHHETFATLASARQVDFAIAVAVGTTSLVAAIAAETLRRKPRPER